MSTFIIIISVILFVAAIVFLPLRMLVAPACSFAGLLVISLARNAQGYPVVPVNTTILMAWFFMTVVVTIATMMQPVPVRDTSKGMGYITVGAIVGMAVGLLAFSTTYRLNMLYALMITATAVGTFLGFLLFTNTPDGRPVGLKSGNFFRYLLAKGFPTAITVMQIGVVLVLVIAIYHRII